MAITIGEVYVAVRPLTTNFAPELQAQLTASVAGAGGTLGADLDKGLKSGTSGVKAATADLAQDVEKKTGNISSYFSNVGSSVKNLESRAVSSFENMTGSSGLLTNALKDLNAQGVSTGASVGVAVGVGLEAAVVGFALEGVKHLSALVEQVRQFSDVTGTSMETASRYVGALNALGLSSDGFGRAVFQLSRRIEDGKVDLAAYGVEVARTKDGTVDINETILRIADAFAASTNATNRNNLAFAAFGRQGLTLIPILARGREELVDLLDQAAKNHEIFTDADFEKARQYEISVNEAKTAVQALGVSVGKDIVPALTSLSSGMTVAAQTVQRFGGALFAAAQAVPGVGLVIDAVVGLAKLGGAHKDAGAAALQHAQDIEALNTQLQANTDATSTLTTATDALNVATARISNTTAPAIDFVDRIATAQANLAVKTATADTAQQSLAALQAKSTTTNDELTTAAKDVAAALADEEKATKSLTDVEKAYADAIDGIINASVSVSELTVQVADDRAKAADDTDTLNKAEKTYNDLLASGGADLEKQARAVTALRDAKIRLLEADQSAEDAAVGVKDKTDALALAIATFGPDSLEAAKAQDELDRANLDVTKSANDHADATDAVTKAQQDYIDASPGSVAASDRIAAAHDKVDQATRTLDGDYRTLAKTNADLSAAIDATNGHVDTAAEKAGHLKDAYNAIAITLAPDSPLRKNLLDTASQIDTLTIATDKLNAASAITQATLGVADAVSGVLGLNPFATAPPNTAPTGGGLAAVPPPSAPPPPPSAITNNFYISGAQDPSATAGAVAATVGVPGAVAPIGSGPLLTL